jgi:hypothetical protein
MRKHSGHRQYEVAAKDNMCDMSKLFALPMKASPIGYHPATTPATYGDISAAI